MSDIASEKAKKLFENPDCWRYNHLNVKQL